MYASNKLAREWMLNNGYNHIWFKAHLKRKDKIYTTAGTYQATDLWNLFDGIAISEQFGQVTFFQVKTNAWPSEDPYLNFYSIKNSEGTAILFINVKKEKNHWVVKTRLL